MVSSSPFLMAVTARQEKVKSSLAKEMVLAVQEWFRMNVMGKRPCRSTSFVAFSPMM